MGAYASWSRWVGMWFCVASLLSAGLAEAQAPGGSPDARALLIKMGEFLGNTQRLSVSVRAAYDSVQTSGQKIEWNELRTLTLSRPDRLRMEAEKSNGARSLLVFDGSRSATTTRSPEPLPRPPTPVEWAGRWGA